MPAIARRDRAEEAQPAHLVKDPVCGMSVDPHTAKYRREHAGRTYYFCAPRCAAKFEAEPQAYLGPERAQAKPAPADAIYTCPMHPEIGASGPAPVRSAAWRSSRETGHGRGDGPSAELPRHAPPVLGVSAILALAAAGRGDGRPTCFGLRPHALSGGRGAHWLQLALATPVVLWAGWPIFARCWAFAAQPAA